ncbi:MAG: hypothetical protein N3E40_04265, partial [Dehalococcoidia bacterium]|nr:hypothetical protein [Dehalococcoidia bacterium]
MAVRLWALIAVGLVIFGLLLGGGCQPAPVPVPSPTPPPKPAAPPAPAPSPTPSPAAFKWPSSLTVVVLGGSANPGYGATVAWTNLLAAETGTRVSVLGEVRVDLASEMLKTKKAEISTGGTSPDYLMATGSFATREGGAFPVRIMSAAAEVEAGFVTKKDSPIKAPQAVSYTHLTLP